MTASGGAPVVLVTGDDALGIEREARLFAAAIPSSGERRTVRVGGVGRPVALAEERASAALEVASTGSLFGEGTFVVVSDAPLLVGVETAAPALLSAIRLVADGNVLALLALADGSGRQPAGSKTLADAVLDAGGAVRAARVPTDMTRWIEEAAPESGVRLGRGAAAELARRLGAKEGGRDIDRRAMAADAAAELAKLSLYREDAEVSVEDVRTVVVERLPASLFDLVDAVATRQARRSIALLDRAATTVAGPIIVARLHRRLREIAIAADLAEHGDRKPTIAVALGWWDGKKKVDEGKLAWRVDHLLGQAQRWGPGEIGAALDGLLAVDAAMKGEAAGSDRAQRLALALWVVERVAPG